MKRFSAICVYVVALAMPELAFAQSKARPDPADAKVSVPPTVYVSPLQQYRPLGDEPVADWKATNDLVEKIGGWREYAREAQEPASAAEQARQPSPQPAPPAKPPAHGGQSGHKMN